MNHRSIKVENMKHQQIPVQWVCYNCGKAGLIATGNCWDLYDVDDKWKYYSTYEKDWISGQNKCQIMF